MPSSLDIKNELEKIYGKELSVLLDAKMDHVWIWDDKEYARQRVAGMNPLVIKRASFNVCQSI